MAPWRQSESFLAESDRGDAELAARIAGGDHEALAELFHEFGGAVKSVAFRVIRDGTLAEDVVQDTFVAFWRAPDRYDASRGSLRTFLMTIAHRRAVDIVRSEESRIRRELMPPDPDLSDLEDEVITRQLSADLRSALDDLAAEERQAISLAYFDGLSYVQVARHLDAPEGTIKSRIRNGMRKLASSMQEVAS
jgi:RNA polymerase sigma-70 factor (ECF subfamily)